MEGVPGADDLLGGVDGWQLLQQVVRQVQGVQVEETPGQHRGQSHQTVGGQVQVDDARGHVHEPVQLQPGQLQMTPADADGLQTQEEELLIFRPLEEGTPPPALTCPPSPAGMS